MSSVDRLYSLTLCPIRWPTNTDCALAPCGCSAVVTGPEKTPASTWKVQRPLCLENSPCSAPPRAQTPFCAASQMPQEPRFPPAHSPPSWPVVPPHLVRPWTHLFQESRGRPSLLSPASLPFSSSLIFVLGPFYRQENWSTGDWAKIAAKASEGSSFISRSLSFCSGSGFPGVIPRGHYLHVSF